MVGLVLLGLAAEFLGDGASHYRDGSLGFFLIGGMVVVPIVLYVLVRSARFVYELLTRPRLRRSGTEDPWQRGGRAR